MARSLADSKMRLASRLGLPMNGRQPFFFVRYLHLFSCGTFSIFTIPEASSEWRSRPKRITLVHLAVSENQDTSSLVYFPVALIFFNLTRNKYAEKTRQLMHD